MSIRVEVHGKRKGEVTEEDSIVADVTVETQGGERRKAIDCDVYRNATGDNGRVVLRR
jgi:hypothetical protein